MNFRTIFTPKSNDIIAIQVLESWNVKWQSRLGKNSDNVQDECEFFLDEEVANAFAVSLRNAFNLLKFTYGTKVTVEKTK